MNREPLFLDLPEERTGLEQDGVAEPLNVPLTWLSRGSSLLLSMTADSLARLPLERAGASRTL